MNKINYKYNGFIDKTMKFAEKKQLLKPELWRRFVQQFREDSDYDAGWRGEYWGKMMRGACFVKTSNYTIFWRIQYPICLKALTKTAESARIQKIMNLTDGIYGAENMFCSECSTFWKYAPIMN